jgi:hypothetical protein
MADALARIVPWGKPLSPDYSAADNGRYRRASEGAAVEGGVPALGERAVYVVGPPQVRIEDGDVAGVAGRQSSAVQLQDIRRTDREQFNETGE